MIDPEEQQAQARMSQLPPEAIGEDELDRPQPADDPVDHFVGGDLLSMMRKTVDRLERDRTAVGDLKILSRTIRELRYAFKVFRPYRRRRKVTIFGSARTPEDHIDFQTAEALGRELALHGWMVITGAGGGIMEAGHKGAGRDVSMGLNIMLPFEQQSNPYIEGDHKLVTLKYFFTRKLMFVKETSAIVCCPGGFGTLDEMFEVITLLQTGKQTMMPVVLLDSPGGSYWSDLGHFMQKHLLHTGMISQEDVHLFKITDSVQTAVGEILGFYRVYHSMRYVADRLVLRLTQRLPETLLQQINDEYTDILLSGTFSQSGPLPEESAEVELSGLTRLVFHFDRKALGRLRMLINTINDHARAPQSC